MRHYYHFSKAQLINEGERSDPCSWPHLSIHWGRPVGLSVPHRDGPVIVVPWGEGSGLKGLSPSVVGQPVDPPHVPGAQSVATDQDLSPLNTHGSQGEATLPPEAAEVWAAACDRSLTLTVFAPSSPEWRASGPAERQRLHHTTLDDGEF